MTFSSKKMALEIPPLISSNRLYYGDNLTIMKNLPPKSVDLIYLDPPFNSQRNYNLIYKQLTGKPVPEQEEAFCDAWVMDPEKEEMMRRMPIVFEEYGVDEDLAKFWDAWIKALRYTQPRLLAYLLYMTVRLFEMRRILSSHGSIYLHCDSHASHYIKVIMDGIFGHNNFRNEIVWKRFNFHSDAKRFGKVTDRILYYTISDNYTFNHLRVPFSDVYVANKFRHVDSNGRRFRLSDLNPPAGRGPIYEFHGITKAWRFTQDKMLQLESEGRIYTKSKIAQLKRYLDELEGQVVHELWIDIPPINPRAKERLGYPTQKPIKLLKRIIAASSNKGDVILDPFCGCGTSVYAAHLLNRKWIGCDIAILSIRLVRDILLKRYGLKEDKDYIVAGIPRSIDAAQELFNKDPRQFQHWAVELTGGFASAKFSGDRGIDGRIHFDTNEGLKNMVLSVKGGKTPTPVWMRELSGVVQQEEDAKMGGLICLESPTKGMLDVVARGGIYSYQGKDYHQLQIRTVQDLLDGNWFDTPSLIRTLGKSSQTIMPV